MLVLVFTLLTACSSQSQTPVSDEAVFVGKGKNWSAKYVYNSKLYKEKHRNWVEITYIGEKPLKINSLALHNMKMKLKSRDHTIKGDFGEMVTKVNNNTILFLVGTVNSKTYKEDQYELTISLNDKNDVMNLSLKK